MQRKTINNFLTGEYISHISQFRQYLIKSWWKRKINYSGCEHCIKQTSSNMCVLCHFIACFMGFAGRSKVSSCIAARGSSLISRPVLTHSREQHVTLAPLSVVSKGATEVKIFPNYLHAIQVWTQWKMSYCLHLFFCFI